MLRKQNSLTTTGKRHVINGVYPEKEFQAVIERECARTDRNGSSFSLIVFALNGFEPERQGLVRFAKTIMERVRSTDEVGWFRDRWLGILLPDTPTDRARALAADINDRIESDRVFPFRIYGYPSEWLVDSSTNSGSSGSGLETGEPGLAESPSATPAKDQIFEEGLEDLLESGIPTWKRVLDILGGSVLLILLFPVFVAVGLLIMTVSPGPVFFRQERVGYLGRPFTMWKFRTMIVDADTRVHEEHLCHLIQSDEPLKKLDEECDSRVILGGGFLRRSALDELPQLINVLRGEMSLVGPRPCIPYEAKEYLLWQRKRCEVKPGLTGLWQVSGKNRTTHTEMMRLDIKYSRQRSFLLDLKILLKTVPAIIAQATGFPK